MGVWPAVLVVLRGIVLAGAWLAVAWETAGPSRDGGGAGWVALAYIFLLSLAGGLVDGVVAARPGRGDLFPVAVSWTCSALVTAVLVAALSPTPDARVDLTAVADAAGLAGIIVPLAVVPALLAAGVGLVVRTGLRRLRSLVTR